MHEHMMTSSNGNIFRVTDHLCGEFTVKQTSDAELWCFLWSAPELTEQSWGWWFETLWCSLWRHCHFCHMYVMMTSSNGKFSALLALCAGNSPVPGEFLAQRPVTRSFDVYFDLRLNKRLCKQSWGWWFETLLCPLWRLSNGGRKIHAHDRSKYEIVETTFMEMSVQRLSIKKLFASKLLWKEKG